MSRERSSTALCSEHLPETRYIDEERFMEASNHDETVRSLLGQRLTPPTLQAAAQQRAEAQLAEARADYERDPSLEHTIWYGRRAAYLFQYQRAIAIYSDGIRRFPDAHQLYRHRGHRLLSTRQFARAIDDLEQAAALATAQPVLPEPDGIPNRLNTPRSTTHFNIWYHLGLAQFLSRSFERAQAAYETCLQYADNDDSLTATVDWLWMTLRRLGKTTEAEALLAQITPTMDLVEDDSYHRRLLLYKGMLTPEELLAAPADVDDPELALATQGYGVGNWYLVEGDPERARDVFQRVLATTNWAAFGYIAAEVELANASVAGMTFGSPSQPER
jgi:tetratricopeptide (TPR) repeat protein